MRFKLNFEDLETLLAKISSVSESLENFGGNTAAPTFSRILKKISPILNRNNYLKMDF